MTDWILNRIVPLVLVLVGVATIDTPGNVALDLLKGLLDQLKSTVGQLPLDVF